MFYDLLNVKLAELLSNPELIKETVTGEGKPNFTDLSQISYHIAIKIHNGKEISRIPELNELLRAVYILIHDEFTKLDIDINTVERVLLLLSRTCSNFTYENLIRSKLIVILLTRQFNDSEKFQILFQKYIKLRKKIFIVKLDDFEMDIPAKLNSFVQVYDMFKHKTDKFEGYVTRNMLVDVRDCLKTKMFVSNLTIKQQNRLNSLIL